MENTPSAQIGSRLIDLDHPVYVIAEAGVNHNGDFATACKLIEAAARSSADAVKFQLFSADRLAAPDAPTCQYQKDHLDGASSQLEMLRKLELPPDDFHRLKARADEIGIDFLCTPFGVAEVDTLARLPVAAIKIASPDIVNVPLLRAVGSTGLPIIASTGAADLDEVRAAVDIFRRQNAADRLMLLHCVSAYPTPVSHTRLRCMSALSQEFNLPVGFSDHTAEPEFSALAVAAGAVILEKHLTLDRSAEGPDHFFSLTPDDFAKYTAAAREAFAARGSGVVAPTEKEVEVRNLSRGSIVAARHITAGTIIRPDSLTVRRPGDGISPADWDAVVGSTAAADIVAGTPLQYSHLQSPISGRLCRPAQLDRTV